jgi:hypothetical protein
VWLAELHNDAGELISDGVAYMPCSSSAIPSGATLRIAGVIEHGVSLVTVHPERVTLIEDGLHDEVTT